MTNRNLPALLAYLLLFLLQPMVGHAAFQLDRLQVEYQATPLGIDIETPRFSWQMQALDNERAYVQTSYRLVVKNGVGAVVWDSGKIASGLAAGIVYAGQSLQPQTRYDWEVTVWDQQGRDATAASWFETGLMDPDPGLSAWNGATWIGARDEHQVFYSHYLSVFKLAYSLALDPVSGTQRAAFLFGGNDRRLMDKDLNIQGVSQGENESYIALELDVSGLEESGGQARFNVYRVGYAPEDRADVPYRSFPVSTELVNGLNKYDEHRFYVECNFGLFEVFLDGRSPEHKISVDDPSNSRFGAGGMNLNPVGRGNNFISFPMLADIGFRVGAKGVARFSDIAVRHFRFPSNVVYDERIGTGYQGAFAAQLGQSGLRLEQESLILEGGERGALILADPSRNGVPMLRTTFAVAAKPIRKARLYVTARGIYEMYLNGKRVGEDYFNPGLTQYNKHHMYQTYDVAELIEPGTQQALGAWLSEGWWSGNITYSGENWNFFGDRQSLLCQLIITYEDGSQTIVTSDPYRQDWKYYVEGPVQYGSFFQGEVYDARREANVSGWSTTAYQADDWIAAVEIPLEGNAYMGTFTDNRGRTTHFSYDDQQLIGQMGANAGVNTVLPAKSVEEVRPGVFVYDLGQNMVGFPRVRLPAGAGGQQITLRYAEMRYPDLPEYGDNVGMIMLENIRAALTQDVYIRAGTAGEVIQPRFTFHGFRYLEITGLDQALPLTDVEGVVISSIGELSSSYETSNALVNKLWENITWSMRGNFLSIPTDTPARNERMGWSGDINVFSRASTYLAPVNQFLRRHLLAMRDIQREDGRFTDVAPVGGGFGGTLWGSAGIIVAWETYQQYGDLQLLREHYDAMKDYLAFLESRIDPETGVLNEGPLGDWLSPEGNKNDNTLFWAAYHAYDLEIMAKVADLLQRETDAATFRERYRERKAFFNAMYVDPQTSRTIKSGVQTGFMGPPGESAGEPNTGKGALVDTQASYAIPLAFDLFNDEHQSRAVQHLVAAVRRENTDDLGVQRPAYSLMTGFIGTASLMQALSEHGQDETAYRLLQQERYPSWLYSVVNGATTIWERLNSYTVEDGFGGNNSMNSFNHYSFGAVAAWMYNYSLGIQRDPESPGFKHFILQPTPDPTGAMTFARGHYDSMYGTIRSEWKLEGRQWIYKATVPANTTATLYLPAASANKIREGEKKLKKVKHISSIGQKDGRVALELVSGDYEFVIQR